MYDERIDEPSDDELVAQMDSAHARAMCAERELFGLIVEAERRELWRDTGARDLPHYLCIRYGISVWKAHRWINSARALEDLPQISDAFSTGVLGVDKVVELTRFAEPETEARLVRWANTVSGATIRRRAELASLDPTAEAREADQERFVRWRFADEGRSFGLELGCPGLEGARIVRAIERERAKEPVMPGEEGPEHVDERRLDALASICSARIARDPDQDRAVIVVHAAAEALYDFSNDRPAWGRSQGCEVECGPVLHPETARRLACDARIQIVLESVDGVPLRLGRVTREPSVHMRRLLRHRDRVCQHSGCGSTRFLQAHHIVEWSRGGATDLDNLILLCSFHHKLVHEYGWHVTRDPDGTVTWFRRDGTRYEPGPRLQAPSQTELPALIGAGR